MNSSDAKRAARREREHQAFCDALANAWASSPFRRPTVSAEVVIANLRREER